MEIIIFFFVILGILIFSIAYWIYVNIKRNSEYSETNLKKNRGNAILGRYDK